MVHGKRRTGGNFDFKFSTKNINEERFLIKLDEKTNFTNYDGSTHGDRFQEGLERTCAEELKSILPSHK